MKAEGDIKRGEELYDSYGTKSNAMFLTNYGFLPENENNSVKMKLPLDPNDPEIGTKDAFYEQHQKIKNPEKEFVIRTNMIYMDMMGMISWMRYNVFDENLDVPKG